MLLNNTTNQTAKFTIDSGNARDRIFNLQPVSFLDVTFKKFSGPFVVRVEIDKEISNELNNVKDSDCVTVYPEVRAIRLTKTEKDMGV